MFLMVIPMSNLSTQHDHMLAIALDYDETFTVNKKLWTLFVHSAKALNCNVTFVTYRHQDGDNDDILADAKELGMPVLFSNGKPKSSVFKPDVWIDDQPITIPSYQSMSDMLDNCTE